MEWYDCFNEDLTVGGYGVLAITWASSGIKKTNNKNVLSDSSGYGGDAIASYNLLCQSAHNTRTYIIAPELPNKATPLDFSLFPFHFSLKFHRIFKRSPFEEQNESFWIAKRVLLDCKTSPFEEQNESFCKAKVVPWLSRSCRSAQLKLPFGITKRQLILNKIDFQRITD